MDSKARSTAAAALLTAVALGLAGCDAQSGGGGSGGAGATGTGPSTSLVFLADRSPLPGSVSMRLGPGSVDQTFELEIVVTELVDLFTIDFELAFPGALLRFESARQGEFLGSDASLVVQGQSVGSVLFLLTRLEPVGVTGTGVVLRVTFTVIAGGTGRLDFLRPEAEDTRGLPVASDWIGGEVRIVL